MSDAVATELVQSLYDRWHRLEDEKRALGDDLKDLFAEAKSQGFKTKLLRKAFVVHRDHEERAAEVAEDEAIVDLYLGALELPRVRARPAREEGKADAAPADRTAIGNHNVGVVGAESTRTTGLNLPGSPLAASVDRAVA